MDSCNNKLIPGTSNFWKLDKIDKIVIALWFIVFAIFCIGDCFASEEITDFEVLEQYRINYDGTLVRQGGSSTYFVPLDNDYKYTITFSGSDYRQGFSDSSDVNAIIYNYLFISGESTDYTYTFLGSYYNYLFFTFSSFDTPAFTLTREHIESMSSSVDSLVNNVGQEQIWSIFDTGIPIALLVVLVAFGIFIIGFASRKIQKGKMGI